jgi:hypothetical protein
MILYSHEQNNFANSLKGVGFGFKVYTFLPISSYHV